MAALRETLISQDAYKSVESEGFLDLYFYRPGGAFFAWAGFRLGLTPNALTAASLITGVAGACLLYFDESLWRGAALLVVSGLFDASDGQLARMTKSSSHAGRILDGVSDYLVFMATYLALGFKYLSLHPQSSPLAIFSLIAAAGISHSMQSSLFDFYRNEYADYADRKMIPRPAPEETETPVGVASAFLAWCHRDYTRRQRALARVRVNMGKELLSRYPGGKIDEPFARKFKDANLPLIWWWNLMGANSRLLVTVGALAAGRPELYFWAELTLYNLCAFATHRRQAAADRSLLASLN